MIIKLRVREISWRCLWQTELFWALHFRTNKLIFCWLINLTILFMRKVNGKTTTMDSLLLQKRYVLKIRLKFQIYVRDMLEYGFVYDIHPRNSRFESLIVRVRTGILLSLLRFWSCSTCEVWVLVFGKTSCFFFSSQDSCHPCSLQTSARLSLIPSATRKIVDLAT
jgi:hypothetical protein